jgi:hypothetical protein
MHAIVVSQFHVSMYVIVRGNLKEALGGNLKEALGRNLKEALGRNLKEALWHAKKVENEETNEGSIRMYMYGYMSSCSHKA